VALANLLGAVECIMTYQVTRVTLYSISR